MTFDSWEDDLERIGWSFGLSTQKQMLADWRTDRAEWRSALKEARQEIARLKESKKPISPNILAEPPPVIGGEAQGKHPNE